MAKQLRLERYTLNYLNDYVARGDIKTITKWQIKSAKKGNDNTKDILEKNGGEVLNILRMRNGSLKQLRMLSNVP